MAIARPSTSRYVEIAADLRRRIVDGREWVPGEKLPSHRALCREYGVTDSVMQSARRILIGEGIIETHPGAGVYVRRQVTRHELVRVGPDAAGQPVAVGIREQGRPQTAFADWSCHSQTITADRALAHLLRVEPGERVMMTEYQVLSAGVMVRLTTTFEPYGVVGGTAIVLPDDGPLAGQGVVERMAAIGVQVQRASDRVIARPSTAAEGELLGGGAGAPALEVTRTYTDTAGQPIHVERTVVRGDRGALLYQVL
ncbi:GntR family transcriptional regulator (plasmid) [Kitasatospora sp. CMC57]|uniref:GntR family transcriptional regulator n=1 Tax=Kitasatospora sp. CMC57 TaxID=3231513 RepID=A0AB33K5G8_9ACTN